MRCTLLVLMVMVATLVGASGVALAVVRSGGPGNDTLIGTNGSDSLQGKGGNDTVVGLADPDNLWGGFNTDVMYGGRGADFLTGANYFGRDSSNDVLYGGAGRDDVVGMGGDDVLYGGDGGDNTLEGPRGREILYGGLHGHTGQDILYGGDGNDFIDASLDRQRDCLFCGNGTDEYAADTIDYVSSSCEMKVTLIQVD
jgi:Ca2+-binding RTX toxin-like protein